MPLGPPPDELAGGEEARPASTDSAVDRAADSASIAGSDSRTGEGDVEFELGRFKGAADAEPH